MHFRGASADAVAALTDRLKGAAGDPERAARAADSFFGVARTLRDEPALRRFATDGTVPVEAKAGLVKEIFGSGVDDVVLDVLTSAVGRRWTRTHDLADAVEYLGVVAAALSTGDDSDRLADELFSVRSLIADNPDLRQALTDPSRTVADKTALLDSLLRGKALPGTVVLARQALAGSHRSPVLALEEYQDVAAELRGVGVATVRVARPLDQATQDRLAQALSRQYDRAIHLDVVVEPGLIGGIRVEIGDDVIDGTVSSRLADAQRQLAG